VEDYIIKRIWLEAVEFRGQFIYLLVPQAKKENHHAAISFDFFWLREKDLNPRPSGYERFAPHPVQLCFSNNRANIFSRAGSQVEVSLSCPLCSASTTSSGSVTVHFLKNSSNCFWSRVSSSTRLFARASRMSRFSRRMCSVRS